MDVFTPAIPISFRHRILHIPFQLWSCRESNPGANKFSHKSTNNNILIQRTYKGHRISCPLIIHLFILRLFAYEATLSDNRFTIPIEFGRLSSLYCPKHRSYLATLLQALIWGYVIIQITFLKQR